jgi:hypothetical protein
MTMELSDADAADGSLDDFAVLACGHRRHNLMGANKIFSG